MPGAFVALPLLLLVVGCYRPETHHPWLAGTQPTLDDSWQRIKSTEFAVVTPDDPLYQRIISMLETTSAAELKPEDLDGAALPPKYQHRGQLQPRAGDRLFAIRGISYGGVAFGVIARANRDYSAVHVHQLTYNGENALLYAVVTKLVPSPLIIRLPNPPATVGVTAEVGGDRIIARFPPEK